MVRLLAKGMNVTLEDDGSADGDGHEKDYNKTVKEEEEKMAAAVEELCRFMSSITDKAMMRQALLDWEGHVE